MSEPKLKPCPFCGGKAEVSSPRYREMGPFWVECKRENNCFVRPKTTYFDEKIEAICAWNIRRDNDYR